MGQAAVRSVCAFSRPVRARWRSESACFTSSSTRSTSPSSSSTAGFHTPPFESMQTWMPASFNDFTSGTSSAAWKVGSPPEKVTPPRRPKKGFWSTAMRRISAGSVNVPAPASIVSGLAQ